jgi:hypothetical protein
VPAVTLDLARRHCFDFFHPIFSLIRLVLLISGGGVTGNCPGGAGIFLFLFPLLSGLTT